MSKSRFRRASEFEIYYDHTIVFDDGDWESETEDCIEEQLNESEDELMAEKVDDERWESEGENGVLSRKRYKKNQDYENEYTWSQKPPELDGRKSRTNQMATPIGRAAAVKTPLESWSNFFDDELLDIIILNTNKEIEREIDRLSKNNIGLKSHHKQIDLIELKALLGLLYFAGLRKISGTSIDDLWSIYGPSLFRITMPILRLKFLMHCMRFDDINTRAQRKITDRFACIREIWDQFTSNCKANYKPSSKCTVGEQLLTFHGKCAFRIYIPAKSDKPGLKIVTLIDAATSYLYNAMPYGGETDDKDPTESISSYYVRKLSEPIYHTKRNITCDSWFTSVPLCDRMLNDYGLTMVGSINKNKSEIPASLKTLSSSDSVKFAYTDQKILVSYTVSPKKKELLLSSYHSNGEIDTATGEPQIAQFFNDSKEEANNFDKRCQDFTVARHTLQWPMRLFYGIMDQANVNSFIIYNLKKTNKLMRRNDFILELCMSLIQPLLRLRLTLPNLRVNTRLQIESFLEYADIPEDQNSADLIAENRLPRHKRCGFCPYILDRKTSYKCLQCNAPMCKEHTAKICINCSVNLSNSAS